MFLVRVRWSRRVKELRFCLSARSTSVPREFASYGYKPDNYRADLVVAWPKTSRSTILDTFVKLIEKERYEIGNQARLDLEAACSRPV